MKAIIYDATLREGAQGMGASFSVEDKLRVVNMLDKLGVSYIEAGNPASNPKDAEFFRRISGWPLKNAKLVAFGSTCRVGTEPGEDAGVRALLDAGTPAVAIFGKSWDFHVTHVLNATLGQNLGIISSTVRFFKEHGREVIYDAEHFFDGYKANPVYAMQTLAAASEAGADWLCLCDTNGGCFPLDVKRITEEAVKLYPGKVGIHCHNDTGMAEANAVIAVQSGATMVQATVNGWGERCGNTDLCTVMANLQLKLGIECIPESSMRELIRFSRNFNEMANARPDHRAPYVGRNAFSHKGGMHIDGVSKNPQTFEHIDPSLVGAERQMLVSEVAGRGAVINKIRQIAPGISKDSPEVREIVDKLKEMEHGGYQFEGAEASFELMVRRVLGLYKPFFSLKGFKVIVNEPALDGEIASAVMQVVVNGEEEITADVGNGPVNALDRAARKALERFYPSLGEMQLTDYKVRVLDSNHATASQVRVLIESSDGKQTWTTVGVSSDIIEASWTALVDSLEYKLLKDGIRTNGSHAKKEAE